MRRAWPLVLLGACGGGSGDQGLLEIHVLPPDRADIAEIELYVGAFNREEPDDSDYPGPIRPAGYARSLPAVWWERDRDPAIDVQAFDSTAAVFRFGYGDERKLESFVAVAFDQGGRPVSMATRLEPTEIPAGEIHRWEMPLLPLDPLPRTTTSPPANGGLQVWGPEADPRACVNVDNVPGLEHYDLAKHALIGTAGDEDCDGLPSDDPRECVRREYMGQKPFASRDALSCTMKQTVVTEADQPTEVCIAGGGTCVDGIGSDPMGCHPSSYCLPKQLCAPGACSRFEPLACEGLLSTPDLSYIECTLSTTDGQSNTVEFCPATYGFDLKALIPEIQCGASPLIRDFTKPFGAQLSYANAGSIFVEATDASRCQFKFVPSGGVPLSGPSGIRTEFPAVFSVPLTAPIDGRGVIVPVLFKITQTGCSTAGACIVKKGAGETIQACVGEPVAPGTHVSDL